MIKCFCFICRREIEGTYIERDENHKKQPREAKKSSNFAALLIHPLFAFMK
jgi:hypothetical protein